LDVKRGRGRGRRRGRRRKRRVGSQCGFGEYEMSFCNFFDLRFRHFGCGTPTGLGRRLQKEEVNLRSEIERGTRFNYKRTKKRRCEKKTTKTARKDRWNEWLALNRKFSRER